MRRRHVMQHPDSPTWCIPLTKGQVAVVDECDYAELSRHRWHATKHGNIWYAARSIGGRKKRRMIYMHREILGIVATGKVIVDHRDRDGLNNRRSNLRKCSQSQNLMNSSRSTALSTSIYKGVWREGKRWRVQIVADGGRIHVGRFETETAAAEAYNLAAQEHHGEFAHLNQI